MRLERPRHNEVHVWRGASLAHQRNDLATLSEEERDRFGRLRKPDDRALFYSAHVGLRRILSKYLATGAAAIVLGRLPCPSCGDGRHGPPRVAWPQTELRFSLAHSGHYWIVALATGAAIGVDTECHVSEELTSAVREVLTLSEGQALGRIHSETERNIFLLRAWTRKEAVCKALGVGLVSSIRSLEVHPEVAGSVDTLFGINGQAASSWSIVDIPCMDRGAAALARPAGLIGNVSLFDGSAVYRY